MKKLILTVLFMSISIAIYSAIGDRLSITNDNGTVHYFNIDNDGDITTAGDQTIVGDVGVTGGLSVTGDTTLDGVVNYSMSSLISLSTATASSLTVTDGIMLVVGSTNTTDSSDTGAYADTISASTPFIATTTATNGDTVIVMGYSSAAYLQLSDNSIVSGSLLELDGSSVTLTALANITLTYYSGKWIQSGGVNIID